MPRLPIGAVEILLWAAVLLVGWLLLLIFMAGTASYYREEISRWMRPELPRSSVTADVAAERALTFLQHKAPQAESWNVTLPDPR
ncbi:MAG: PepSY domain-containing protein, partial [Stenotrophomonas maltophilia]